MLHICSTIKDNNTCPSTLTFQNVLLLFFICNIVAELSCAEQKKLGCYGGVEEVDVILRNSFRPKSVAMHCWCQQPAVKEFVTKAK